jgi:hypothetical protein
MATSTTTTYPVLPDYAKQPTADMAATLQELLNKQVNVPEQKVAGFSQPQLDAMARAQQGIGAYQPFLDAAQASQAAALGTTGAGVQALGQMNFDPSRAQAFMDPYQQSVTNEALKEIDRQAAMAQNQLAGKAVQAGAFGGSRFGLQQSETARNAQDLKSRRIFEDLSRNYQQAQSAAQAANTQRMQQAQQFGNLGKQTSGIGGMMAGLGAQTQQLGQSDINQLMGIGGMQQQLAQRMFDTDTANVAAMENAPFQRLSAGAGILGQLLPGGAGTQVVAPFAQTNPYAQAAGLFATGAGGLGALMGN